MIRPNIPCQDKSAWPHSQCIFSALMPFVMPGGKFVATSFRVLGAASADGHGISMLLEDLICAVLQPSALIDIRYGTEINDAIQTMQRLMCKDSNGNQTFADAAKQPAPIEQPIVSSSRRTRSQGYDTNTYLGTLPTFSYQGMLESEFTDFKGKLDFMRSNFDPNIMGLLSRIAGKKLNFTLFIC